MTITPIARATLVALLLVAAPACWTPVPSGGRGHLEGELAPEFELTSVRGDELSLADVRGPQATLLDFWATWCAPCILEMPHLQALYNKYRHEGFEVVGIACDSQEDQIPGVVQERGVTYTNLIGTEDICDSTKNYRITGYPTLLLLDGEGRVFKRFQGAVPAEDLASWIEQALEASGESPPAGEAT